MTYVSDSKFWHLHRGCHRSPAARDLKERLYKRQGGRCARCGESLPPWGGVLNLTTYDGMKRGRVEDSQANLLHRSCHPKGTYTWDKLRSDRSSDIWRRAIEWVIFLPWRLTSSLVSRRSSPRTDTQSRR